MTGVLTVGHGTLAQDELAALLRGAGVDLVLDVRRFPGSRKHPQFHRDALAEWLPATGVAYRWVEDLGGRRHRPRSAPVEDPWWTVEQFRSYAAYTRTPAFATALDDVVRESEQRRVAVMCSESVWWRCHRRIIADVLVLGRQVPVSHLMHTGARRPHQLSDGARRRPDGAVVWDRAGQGA